MEATQTPSAVGAPGVGRSGQNFPDLEFVKEQHQAAWSRPVRNVLLKVNAFISIKSKNSNNEPCVKNTVGKHW